MIANLWGGNLIALGFLATGIGALPVLFSARVSDRLLHGVPGFAIMMLLDNRFG